MLQFAELHNHNLWFETQEVTRGSAPYNLFSHPRDEPW